MIGGVTSNGRANTNRIFECFVDDNMWMSPRGILSKSDGERSICSSFPSSKFKNEYEGYSPLKF